MNILSDEAIRQRTSQSTARHRQFADTAKDRIDAVIAEIQERIASALRGTPVVDDGDASLNRTIDEAVLAIEALREFCVDAPRAKPAQPTPQVVEDEDDDNICVNLLEATGTVVIFGGENDQQKLDRIRQQTGLGERLIWHGNPSVYRLIASLREGKVLGVVVLTGLISHSDFNPLNAEMKSRQVPNYMIHKPGINTIVMALNEIDAYTQPKERVQHSRIRGAYRSDPIASRWYDKLLNATVRISLGDVLSSSELFKLAGLDPSTDMSENKRMNAVMRALGWERVRGGANTSFRKVASPSDNLSDVK